MESPGSYAKPWVVHACTDGLWARRNTGVNGPNLHDAQRRLAFDPRGSVGAGLRSAETEARVEQLFRELP